MKWTSLAVLLIGLSRPVSVHAQLSGTWMGKIGGSLPLVFHFVSNPNGEVTGSMDSPNQHANGLGISKITVTKDSLICELTVPVATYAAARVNDSTFAGTWIQGPARVPLQIKKLSSVDAQALAPVVHPQTPVPPFPYNSDSVAYDNADKSVHLGGTLTYPKTGGPFPVAVLITGSGIQDRDETIFGQKPFAVIADYLTRRGYAVLRVDDRTAGLSTGDVDSATSADFGKDVETSLSYLKTRKEIDHSRMGLIGHSEGGMIAPLVAARNPSVAFIILLAGPAEGGYGTMMYQTAKPFKNANASAAYIRYVLAREKVLLDNIVACKDSTSFVNGVDSGYRSEAVALADSLKIPSQQIIPADQFKALVAPQAKYLVSPWWKFFLSYQPGPDFDRLTCPILALGGSEDIQVQNAVCFEAMKKMLKPSEQGKLETHLLPGLNHLFQHCKSCTVEEYGTLPETFSPDALKIMGDWMDTKLKF